MISAQLEKILQYAYTRARAQQQEFIGVEHLLLALMERSDDVAEILNGVGVDFALLSEQLASSIIENTPTVPQRLCRSPDSISTRVDEAVPCPAGRTRTL